MRSLPLLWSAWYMVRWASASTSPSRNNVAPRCSVFTVTGIAAPALSRQASVATAS